jgi:predicted  nucleic acid-binding Zn ribbon protein
MMPKIFNPLDDLKIEPQKPSMVSTSLSNDSYGVCPKCNKYMTPTKLINDEEAIWCESCRVTSPIKALS